MKNRVGALSVILAAVLLTGTAMASPGIDNHACQKRIAKAQRKLEKAIHKHGYQSVQAERGRQKLAEARASCK